MQKLNVLLIATIATMGTLSPAQVISPAATPVIIGLPAGATYPQVVSSNPVNGSTGASPGSRQITINFDQPMNTTTFYWQPPSGLTLTQTAYWTNGNKTFIIPAQLQNNVTYQIPLNVTDQAFKSAQGIPLMSGHITFTTGQGGVAAPRSTRPGGAGARPIVTTGGTPIPYGGTTGTGGSTGAGTATMGGTSTGGGTSAKPLKTSPASHPTPFVGAPAGTTANQPMKVKSSAVRGKPAGATPTP